MIDYVILNIYVMENNRSATLLNYLTLFIKNNSNVAIFI